MCAEVLFTQNDEKVWATVTSTLLNSLVKDAATVTAKEIEEMLLLMNRVTITYDDDMRLITAINTSDAPKEAKPNIKKYYSCVV